MRKKADKSRGPRKGFVDFLSPYFSKGAMHQPILGKGYVDLIRFCPAEKFLAAFLSALIVMLPVASMSVFADTDGGIINPLVSDSKRVPGFVRGSLVPGGGTTFDLRATVKIPNDADLGCPNCQQFRITRPGAPAPEGFQSCTRVGATDYFDCLHILSTLEVGSNKVFSIAAELLTDAGAVFDTASFNGIIDEEAPVINSLSASPQLISTDDLQFTLSVKDTANAETISCSGMKYALFTYGATFSRTVDMVSNNCEVDTVISINAKDIIPLPPDPLSEDEGDIPIKVKVFDRLDQASAEATATFELDRVIPDIKPGTFRLLDSRGRDISYASSSQIPATAIIEISDKNIDLGSIKANFMSLKDANGAPAATGCTLAQGTAICRWEGLAVEIPQSIDPAAQIKDFVIQINASDFVLNNATFDLTYHIELDNTPPGVAEVKTGYKSQDVNYLGKKFNNITVVLAETGSGFASKDIFLDLTSINGTPHAAPNWCEKAGSFWECVWNDTQVTAIDGVQQISIEPDSADDVGNLITGELSHSIIVDKTDPVIGAASYAPTAPVSGDTIAFSFTAQDNALQLIALLQPLPLIPVPELKAYAETSSISTREGFQGACTGAYDCTVNANELFSAYTEAVINLTAKDPAGNTAKKEVPIIIYRGDPSGTPNFFTIGRIEPVPPSIDKKVASLTPLQLYFYTQLNKVGSQAQNDGVIVHNTLDCRESAGLINGDTATDPALLLQLGQRLPYYLMNEDSLEPIIAIESSNQIGTMESPLKFKCKMILQVRDATTVYANPEIEEVTVNVRLHGNGLGDLQDNINQKLEDINKDITDTEKDISSLEKWVNIFGIYCNIAQTIGTLSSALQLLKSALWPPLTVVYSACLACAICHCAGAIKALWTGICSITGKINWLADSFFWPTGFAEPFQIVGWILKISCMIFYYCALADWKTIASLVYSVVQDTRTTVAKFSGDIPIGTKTQEESTTKDGIKQKGTYLEKTSGGWEKVEVKYGNDQYGSHTETGRDVTPLSDTDIHLMTTDGELVPSTGTIEEASDKTKLLRQGTTVTKSGDMTFNQALDQGLSATQRTPKAPAAKTGIIARGLTGIKKFNSALGGGPDSTLYRDDNYLWSQASKPTEGAGYLTSGAPSFNPYISKHYAQKTLCLPAIIFNKKKEKQVKCLYRNCIQNHLMRGEPTTICDFANKERNCLYVESAYYLKYHYRGWADNMIKGIIQFAVMLIPGLIHKKLCFTYYATAGQDFCSNPPPFGWRPVLCGIASGYFFFQEISAVFGSKFGFGGSDSQKLTGPDFCSGEEDGLG